MYTQFKGRYVLQIWPISDSISWQKDWCEYWEIMHVNT